MYTSTYESRYVSRTGPDGTVSASRLAKSVAAAAPDLVYHLASHAWAAPRLDLVSPTFRSGPVTLVNLLVALAESGRRVRVVMPGSQNEPLPGSGEPPASPYAAAKAAEGLYCELFEQAFGMPFVRLRLFPAYGPDVP